MLLKSLELVWPPNKTLRHQRIPFTSPRPLLHPRFSYGAEGLGMDFSSLLWSYFILPSQ